MSAKCGVQSAECRARSRKRGVESEVSGALVSPALGKEKTPGLPGGRINHLIPDTAVGLVAKRSNLPP
jgi:hypothetical protein